MGDETMWITTFAMTFEWDGDENDADFRSFALRVYAELSGLKGFSRPELAGRIEDFKLALTVTVPADTREDATHTASTAFRTALHAAGADTADWDDKVAEAVERASITTQPVSPKDRDGGLQPA